jgi:hypothetical protein
MENNPIIEKQEENLNNKNPIELLNDHLIKKDSTSIDSETKTKNILSSNLRNSDETRYNSDNKSISIERPEKIDDLIQPSQSSLNNNDNNIINKSNNKKISYIKFSSPTKSTKIPNKFNLFLERNEGFQRRQKENLDELQKGYEQNIKKLMKEKPEISHKSRLIDKKNSLPKNFLDRVKEQDDKFKQRKEKLKAKINLERAKKKEEIDKPLTFNKKSLEDKKFNKIYEAMMERQKEVKDRFKIFNEVVNEYNMKECTFVPKINKYENDSQTNSDNESENKINKNNNIIKRLYNEEIEKRNKKKENLLNKYKPSFHPKINNNAERLSRNWKSRLYKNRTIYDYAYKNDILYPNQEQNIIMNKSFEKKDTNVICDKNKEKGNE